MPILFQIFRISHQNRLLLCSLKHIQSEINWQLWRNTQSIVVLNVHGDRIAVSYIPGTPSIKINQTLLRKGNLEVLLVIYTVKFHRISNC